MPWIKESECISCGQCIPICPEEAIIMKDDKAYILQQKCTKCGACLTVCPVDIIRPNSENNSLKGNGSRGFNKRGQGFGRR